MVPRKASAEDPHSVEGLRSSNSRPIGGEDRRDSGIDRSESGGTEFRLPTRIEKFCVIRSPFIDKDSQEQFEIRTHKRLIDVLEPSGNTIRALMRLNLPAGVDIEIKL